MQVSIASSTHLSTVREDWSRYLRVRLYSRICIVAVLLVCMCLGIVKTLTTRLCSEEERIHAVV